MMGGEIGMPSATMTIQLDEGDKRLITDYAKTFETSVSEFMRRCAVERIEDELDLQAWREAKVEFDSDPATISTVEIAWKYL